MLVHTKMKKKITKIVSEWIMNHYVSSTYSWSQFRKNFSSFFQIWNKCLPFRKVLMESEVSTSLPYIVEASMKGVTWLICSRHPKSQFILVEGALRMNSMHLIPNCLKRWSSGGTSIGRQAGCCNIEIHDSRNENNTV